MREFFGVIELFSVHILILTVVVRILTHVKNHKTVH